MINDEPDSSTYCVVVNDEGQYSICLAGRTLPTGWYAEGTKGTRGVCLAHVGEMHSRSAQDNRLKVAATPVRHLISIADLDAMSVRRLVERSAWYAVGNRRDDRPLRGRAVGVCFRKASTLARTAFSRAALSLGADVITYEPSDLRENTGEMAADARRVLSQMLDALVIRTAGSVDEMRTCATQDRMAIINAMTADEHPPQALADLATIHRHLGGVDGVRLLYVGEGNNTAAALVLALASFDGVELHLRTPTGYGFDERVLAAARRGIEARGGLVAEEHDMSTPMKPCDVVYTTRWQIEGIGKPDPGWRTVFAPFCVSPEVMAAHPGAVVMHDLPAHRGQEVDARVLDGPGSIAFEQAEGKMAGAMAALEWCLAYRAAWSW